MKERTIYLKLLAKMERAHNALDEVDATLHELLNLHDENEAARILKDHQQWMDSDDTKD